MEEFKNITNMVTGLRIAFESIKCTINNIDIIPGISNSDLGKIKQILNVHSDDTIKQFSEFKELLNEIVVLDNLLQDKKHNADCLISSIDFKIGDLEDFLEWLQNNDRYQIHKKL